MLEDREQIRRNVEDVRRRIAGAATRSGRDPDTVTLVAVTKTVEIERIPSAVEAGVLAFGENYVRISSASRRRSPASRGTTSVPCSRAPRTGSRITPTSWRRWPGSGLPAPGRSRRSVRADDRRADRGRPDGRSRGVRPDELAAFADLIGSLSGLRLIGLVTVPSIPRIRKTPAPRSRGFRGCGNAPERHPDVLETSMGMSLDSRSRWKKRYDGPHRTALFGPRATDHETEERADEHGRARTRRSA